MVVCSFLLQTCWIGPKFLSVYNLLQQQTHTGALRTRHSLSSQPFLTISNWMVLNWLDDIRCWSTPYPKWSHLICVERSPHWHPGVFWLHRSSCCLPFYANESSAWCFFVCKKYVCHPQAAAGMMLPCWMMVSKDQHQGLKKNMSFDFDVFFVFNSQRLKTMWLVIDWKPSGCLLEIIIWYDFSLVFSKL